MPPSVNTFALLMAAALPTAATDSTTAAYTPGNLFAMIAMPWPVPHISTALSWPPCVWDCCTRPPACRQQGMVQAENGVAAQADCVRMPDLCPPCMLPHNTCQSFPGPALKTRGVPGASAPPGPSAVNTPESLRQGKAWTSLWWCNRVDSIWKRALQLFQLSQV